MSWHEPEQVTVSLSEGGRLLRFLALSGLVFLVFLDPRELHPAWILFLLLPGLLLGAAWLLGRGRLGGLRLGELDDLQGFSSQRLPIRLHAAIEGQRSLRDLGLLHGDRGGANTTFALLPRLAPEETVEVEGLMILPARGTYDRHQVRAVSSFPWNLWTWQADFELPTDMVCWPRLGSIRALDLLLPRLRDDQGAQRQRSLLGQEFHGLEEWRPGQSLRQVHWRSTAHRGRLMIRINEAERQGVVQLRVLPPRSKVPVGHRHAAYERSLSLAASLCEAMTRRRRQAEVQVVGVRHAFSRRLARGQHGFFGVLHAMTRVELPPPGEPPPPTPIFGGAGFQLTIVAGAGTCVDGASAVLDPLDPVTRRWFRDERVVALQWQAPHGHAALTRTRARIQEAAAWEWQMEAEEEAEERSA